MPVFNGLAFTRKSLANLTEAIGNVDKDLLTVDTLVVDDGSTDGTGDFIRLTYPGFIVLQGNGNLWWSGSMNVGARFACEELKADYVALWNNDILCEPDYFNILLGILEKNDDHAVIGSKIFAKENLVWSMGGLFNPYSGKKVQLGSFAADGEQFNQVTEADWLPGMGTIVHTDVIRRIGYWDDENFPQYHGDSDFTYRARLAGYSVRVYPTLKIWNDITNTGLEHKGSFSVLLHSMKHIKSYNNIRIDCLFYKKFARSPFAYVALVKKYGRLIGGFFKWKILNSLGVHKK
jgi:GT2 family glycosyltransferase